MCHASPDLGSMETPGDTTLLEWFREQIALLKHEDSLRQQRASNFLTCNSIMLVALAAALGLVLATF